MLDSRSKRYSASSDLHPKKDSGNQVVAICEEKSVGESSEAAKRPKYTESTQN